VPIDAEDMDALAERVAERLARRAQAAQVGRDEPCEVSDAPAKAQQLDCADTCSNCDQTGGCATYHLVQIGADRVAPLGPPRTSSEIARHIDHTLLKPDATRQELEKLCDEARRYGFATVCVNSVNVAYAATLLRGTSTVPIAVVGFPLGAAAPRAKAYEAREAVRCGAREIDMVVNQGALKSSDYQLVLEDIEAVVNAVKPTPVKVILETGALTQEQKIAACVLAKAAGAAYVKTSTGFGPGGATAEDIALMRRVVGTGMGVKASGGIRTTEDANKMFAAGADRIGASASVAIVTGQSAGAGKY
jgi:deoxyribose-phosphate aldolase